MKANFNKRKKNSKYKTIWEINKGINEFTYATKEDDGTIVADTTSILSKL